MIYNVLQSDFRCQYIQTCLNMFPENLPEFFKLLNTNPTVYEFVIKPVYQYCLSKENHVQCVRFKMRQEGKEPPPGLSPSGQSVNMNDSVLKSKIILEQSSGPTQQ
jgi:hypothetical protein